MVAYVFFQKYDPAKTEGRATIQGFQQRHEFVNVISPACFKVFDYQNGSFKANGFGDLYDGFWERKKDEESAKKESISIDAIIHSNAGFMKMSEEAEGKKDSFQPIIDFPNFLLIVLKIYQMNSFEFKPTQFNLDDKELLSEFKEARMDAAAVKEFIYLLLKSRYFLDNYMVHHSNEADTLGNNPWKLQIWYREARKGQLRNTCPEPPQDKLVQLLSMFEVAFTARQRKNYLFYCLLYLNNAGEGIVIEEYVDFVEKLADRYFHEVYLDPAKLNAIHTPLPGSFDEVVLAENKLRTGDVIKKGTHQSFVDVYGDGKEASKGISLFVFNYLDYKIWKKYDATLRGKKTNKESKERIQFFEELGCGDFELTAFDQFYFSRTRRSLEHYYPQAKATGKGEFLNHDQINCFGNYAMIGSDANSSGSDWLPKTKLDHYQDDPSVKISKVSVASLKFYIMMQICREKDGWEDEEIKAHQEKMVWILVGAEKGEEITRQI